MLVKVQKGVAGLITEAIAIISEHSHRNRESFWRHDWHSGPDYGA